MHNSIIFGTVIRTGNPRQFEYLFSEISKIQARHQMKKERGGKSSSSRARSTVSPSGAKHSSANYQQFEEMEDIQFEIVCAYSEIYNDQIFDLLDATLQKKLQIREDVKKGIFLEGETQVPVKNMKDLMELMNKGQRNRTVASTNMNRESSRSHAIFTATIRTITVDQDNQKMVRSSRLNVIDCESIGNLNSHNLGKTTRSE